MKAPTPDALGFGLLLSRACARLTLSMEDRLGDFHGLDFEDFRLLHRLVLPGAEGGAVGESGPGAERPRSGWRRQSLRSFAAGWEAFGAGGRGHRPCCVRASA